MSRKIFNKIISSPVKLAKLTSDREKGFTFPAAMATGLLIVGIAMAATMNAKSGELDAEMQNQNEQAKAVAEGAKDRMLGKFNTTAFAPLLQAKYDGESQTWTLPPAEELGTPCFDSNNTPETTLTEGEIGNGYFKVHSYEYLENTNDPTDDTGILVIDAERLKGNEEAGKARLKVEIKINEPEKKTIDPALFPGLWAKSSIKIGNNDVLDQTPGGINNANVICQGCNFNEDAKRDTYCENPGDSSVKEAAKDAIGAKNNNTVDGNIYIGKIHLPPVLTPPTDPNLVNDLSSF